MHAPRLAEHFADRPTQQHAVRLAMWVFLASELLLFAGLFALYAAYRARYPFGFSAAIDHNTLGLGTLNTFVLLSSSLTAALAVSMVRIDRTRLGLLLLGVTLLLGIAFLAIKGVEYGRHIDEGLLPGRLYASSSLTGKGAVIFYTLYWFATGLHAVHVGVGLVVLCWLALRVAIGRIDASDPVALEAGAMYWHLVDIVWLVLWPLLYLAR